MSIRYDIEIATAQCLTSYLQALLTAEIDDLPMQEKCPVVTFYDPMSIQEDDRIIVRVATSQSNAESPGNFAAAVELALKSQWKQPTLSADFARHFARLNALRSVIWVQGLAAELAPYTPAGFAVNFVDNTRQNQTEIMTNNLILSVTAFNLRGLAVET